MPRQPKPSFPGNPIDAINDLFNNAPTVAPITKPKSKKGTEREEVELTGLDKLAAFKVLEKVLEQESAGEAARIREEVVSIFVQRSIDLGKKPDSFVGVGVSSAASCEIRRRGSNMPLDADTAATLEAKGLGACVNKTVKVPERLILNPDLPQDALARLATLVKSDPVLKSQVVVMKQPEEFAYTVSESALDLLAKSGDEEIVAGMIERMATFAVGKFKLDGEAIEAKVGEGEAKQSLVTPRAKKKAIEILVAMGVLPAPSAPALPAPAAVPAAPAAPAAPPAGRRRGRNGGREANE